MSNLLNLIFERLEYERLIEEGKDPVEVLHYKFQNVPSDVIDAVISVDPTKKKSYSQWLLSHWDNEGDVIAKALKNGRIEKLFQHFKQHNDIQIKDFPSVEDVLRSFVPEEDTVLTKSTEPTTYIENLGREVDSDLANDFDIVFNEDNWLIAVPNTYEAECKLGENMKWCTANAFGNGEGYYKRYLSEGGKYYVNFDMSHGESRNGKDYPFTRYQFHFESRQFMDKNDDPVELDDIDIPDSAIEFYSSEGYDTTDFENEEARWERYNEQRNESYYHINDDLYLNIAYDDNYEYEEPDDSTDFYLFDINDDRDPIIWDEIPNPFAHDDAIIHHDESNGIILFKTQYCDEDSAILAIKENNGSSWRDWSAYKLERYFIMPNLGCVFGVVKEHYNQINCFAFFTENGKQIYEGLDTKTISLDNIFINEQCTNADEWGRVFIETGDEDSYHTLFALSVNGDDYGNMQCIVKRDVPKNDAPYFTLDENGMIYGEFRSYRVYNDEDYDEDESYHNYHLVKELENGNYVVSSEEYSQGEYHEKRNVMVKGTSNILLSDWVDKVIGYGKGIYLCELNNQFLFFNENGEIIGDAYDDYKLIDSDGFAAGIVKHNDSRCDIISGREGRKIATFVRLINRYAVNGVISVMDENGQIKFFDLNKKAFVFNEFETIKQVDTSHSNIFYCKINGREENVIFDFDNQRIVSNHIVKVDLANRIYDVLKLTKTDGKVNLFSLAKVKELLNFNVDNAWYCFKVILYVLNGKFYAYSEKNNRFILNPNGCDIIPEYNPYNASLEYKEGKYALYFRMVDGEASLANWYNITDKNDSGYRINENTPPEVIDLYNRITGENLQTQQQEPQQEPAYSTVGEEFKRFMKRIDEAENLRKNEHYD